MGNITEKVGDFQASVGILDADVKVVGAWVVAVILTVFGVGLGIMALIPHKPKDCPNTVNDASQRVHTLCTNRILSFSRGGSATMCNQAKQDKQAAEEHCAKKVQSLWMLLGLLLIPLAVGIVWLAKWWQRMVEQNRTVAQVIGTIDEVDVFDKI